MSRLHQLLLLYSCFYVQYNDCVVFIFTKSRNKTIKSIKIMLKNILMLKHPITDIYIYIYFCENEKTTLFLNIYNCNGFISAFCDNKYIILKHQITDYNF